MSPRPLRAWLFWLLVAVGIGERYIAADLSKLGIEHPDEHQQYLEQAYGRVHGRAVRFWEQERGMRNLLFSDTLALGIRGLEALGVTDPFEQSHWLRFGVASLVFGVLALWAWFWFRAERYAAAFFLLFVMVVALDVIYIHVRLLTENVTALPLMASLLLERRYPRVAGFLWAVMFAIRFQTAFLVAGLGLWTFGSNVRAWRSGVPFWQALAPTCRLFEGLLLGFAFIGWYDYRSFQDFPNTLLGGWFHSPLEYLQANIFEDMASRFGTEPWYYYFTNGWAGPLLTSPIYALLILPVVKSQGRLIVASLLFVVGHSCVAHKELRFLWCLLPIGLVLMSLGFERIVGYLTQTDGLSAPAIRKIAAIGLTFVLPSAMRLPSVGGAIPAIAEGPLAFHWEKPDFSQHATSAYALEWVGRQPDLQGVMMWGFFDWAGGNHFYYRHPRHGLIYHHEVHKDWCGDEPYNYVVVLDDVKEQPLPPGDFETIRAVPGAVIYRKRAQP